MKIILRDRNEYIAQAWRTMFRGCDDVEVGCGHIFEVTADAIVSPANSFGFMNGGIDAVYSTKFGVELQFRLQERLRKFFGGEIFVGQALVVETGHADYPWLISAPTMYVPMSVEGTINAYLAFRAALQAVKTFNEMNKPQDRIESILCPGLGTAIGQMSPQACAFQMRKAYDVFKGHVHDFDELEDAWRFHEQMRRGVE